MDRRFPIHGAAGAAVLAAGMGTTFAGLSPWNEWTTPICWWGWILFADALLKRMTGDSPLCDRPREFFLRWLPLSVVFWVFFEVVNLHLENWYYVNFPKSRVVTAIGSVVSFATVLPGMFLTSELIRATGAFRRCRLPPIRITGRAAVISCLFGFACLIVPLLLPREWARYTFALVWIGIFFLLEPVNAASGEESVLADLTEGKVERFLSLMAGGYAAGLLWEFWNFWAATKWVYSAPFTESLKYFEMPLAGFLGFGPFALEYFAMYRFALLILPERGPRRPGAIA